MNVDNDRLNSQAHECLSAAELALEKPDTIQIQSDVSIANTIGSRLVLHSQIQAGFDDMYAALVPNGVSRWVYVNEGAKNRLHTSFDMGSFQEGEDSYPPSMLFDLFGPSDRYDS